jgi:SnoaL-like domain
MEPSHAARSFGAWNRRAVFAVAMGLTAAVGLSSTTPAEGSHRDYAAELRDRAEIEALGVCYASATDAISKGALEEGRRLYRKCFTSDAVIGASFPGTDPSGPPDFFSIGPDAWADTVNSVFVNAGYAQTQHMMSNFVINIDGDRATMSSYLNATHVLDAFGSIDLANGTYVDEIVRTRRGWKISRRTLRLISFMRVDSPTP